MQRRNLLLASMLLATAGLAAAQTGPKIAVTDLAYTENVRQYFEVGTAAAPAPCTPGQRIWLPPSKAAVPASLAPTATWSSASSAFTNDIKGAILKGAPSALVQAKAFDAGAPQPTKAEQVLNQVKTGKMAQPVRQPQVKDIVDRIKRASSQAPTTCSSAPSAASNSATACRRGSTTFTHQFTPRPGRRLLADQHQDPRDQIGLQRPGQWGRHQDAVQPRATCSPQPQQGDARDVPVPRLVRLPADG